MDYDEVELIYQVAAEAGVPAGEIPPPRRERVRPAGRPAVSALRWGDRPRLVLLHGGGQNAHTWDRVLVQLRVPALAIDLPGHGHSEWRVDRDYQPRANAEAIEPVIERLAPDAAGVVGMSLGGLTAIRLAAKRPDLVRRAVIVDVTPGVGTAQAGMSRQQRGTTALVTEPPVFDSFEAMCAAVTALSPRRDPHSLRRGVRHNAKRLPDGRWSWRYDRLSMAPDTDFTPLWTDVAQAPAPMMLVRGASGYVRDVDADEFVARKPGAPVRLVAGAGHSVQSDAPGTLADLIREFILEQPAALGPADGSGG